MDKRLKQIIARVVEAAFAKMRYVGVNRGVRELGEQVAKDTIDLCVDVIERLNLDDNSTAPVLEGPLPSDYSDALRELKGQK